MSATKAPNKEIRVLAKKVKPYGWTWRIGPGGHVIFTGPHGKGRVVVGASNSDHRAMKNVASSFKQQGVDLRNN